MGSLVDEFTRSYDHNFQHKSLTVGHERQISVLKTFVEELNKGGLFKATLDKAAEAAPVLKIDDGDQHLVVFMVSYCERGSNDIRLVLSPVTTKQPLYGHTEGYNLAHHDDRMQMMRDLGCFVARRAEEIDILRETTRAFLDKTPRVCY